MKEDYTDIIQQVSQVVFEAIKDREENLSESVKELDSELAKLLRLIGREVEVIALDAESYVEKRLLALETKFKNLVPPKRRSGWNRVLVELDGCQIRTL